MKACQGFMKTLYADAVDNYHQLFYNHGMDEKLKQSMADAIRDFHMPRYAELPNVGLYLEQTVKYINHSLEPLGYAKITGSMIRNYVKQDLVDNPKEKLYYADQIAYLISITILKQITSLDHIQCMFGRQRQVYSNQVAYDYFCNELENILYYRFGLKEAMEDIGNTDTVEKEMLRSAVTAVSHIIYMNICLDRLDSDKE